MNRGPSLLVDLRVAQTNSERGVPRYCQSLVKALARERPGLEIACLIDPDRDPPLLLEQIAPRVRIIEGTSSIADDGRFTHFLQSSAFDERKPVRTLFPAELAAHRPRLGAIVYDLIPWVFPETYLADAGRANDYLRIIPALQRLDRVFTISESVRRDVIAIAGADPSRVVTIYGGLDEERWHAEPTSEGTPTDPDVDPGAPNVPLPTMAGGHRTYLRFQNDEGEPFAVAQPFWLYVAGDDFRKNLPRLIEALGLLKRDGRLDAPLVVACSIRPGRRAELLGHAAANGLSPGTDIVFTGYVSDDTLGELFAGCMATVFPSLYEGLGLPVLESYAFGKPALASDSSSLREIVPELCRFDPYSAASISDAMLRLRDDPRVSAASRAYAPQAIALCRWSAAARKLGHWLDEPTVGAGAAPVRSMWVAASLPPATSGVAIFTQRSLGAPDRPVTFFAPVPDSAGLEVARHALARARHGLQREAAPAHVLPLTVLAEARRSVSTQPVLFVLGNSEHHLDTLAHLLTHGARPLDAVHLHEVYIGYLLRLHFRTKKLLRVRLLDDYSEELVDAWLAGGLGALAGAGTLLGPRILVRRAGVRRFVVNSAAAADLLRLDLGEDATDVRIDVLFLPVQPAAFTPAARSSERLLIGHFGYLGPAKHPDRLVAACDILARRRPLELVLAGYGVTSYVSRNGLQREYQRLVESPSDHELEEIMSTVDCAVQLRYPDLGSSSGVLNQLLALRRPVVCTRTGSFAEMDGIVHLVAPDVSPAELAVAIEQAAASDMSVAANEFVAQRSPSVFEGRLRALLELDPGTVPIPAQGSL